MPATRPNGIFVASWSMFRLHRLSGLLVVAPHEIYT